MSCPRCEGQMLRDQDGPTCLQCGYCDPKVPQFVLEEGALLPDGKRARRRQPTHGKTVL